MAKPYSQELRERVKLAVESGQDAKRGGREVRHRDGDGGMLHGALAQDGKPGAGQIWWSQEAQAGRAQRHRSEAGQGRAGSNVGQAGRRAGEGEHRG